MQIRIEFLSNLAPETVAAVHSLAEGKKACQGCKFYRNEKAPPQGSLGPPYGLLQVPMASKEASLVVDMLILHARDHAPVRQQESKTIGMDE